MDPTQGSSFLALPPNIYSSHLDSLIAGLRSLYVVGIFSYEIFNFIVFRKYQKD